MSEQVVLVNEQDEPQGLMDKLEAHKKALLHRAISVFVFNDKDELLLQQRAESKYHSPKLWTNTCCTHPREKETYLQAAERRLFEEMGFRCELTFLFDFIYKADVGQGLFEHELDYVFSGKFNEVPKLNPQEVMAYRWISLPKLHQEIRENPQNFTVWFKIIFNKYLQELQQWK